MLPSLFRVIPASFLFLLLGSFVFSIPFFSATAQSTDFDPSWYDPARPYLKIGVVEDGVYHITGADLAQAGVPTTSINPLSVQIFEKGKEIPLWYTGDESALADTAQFLFVGQRNDGTDELWAYQDQPDWQSSTYYSLYSDTTYYWLTWGQSPGLRYQKNTDTSPFTDLLTFRDTKHVEDPTTKLYYDGDGRDTENPFYTRGEGHYWAALNHAGSTTPIEFQTRVRPVHGFVRNADTMYVNVRVYGITATRHRITLEVETFENNATTFHHVFDDIDWTGYGFQTLQAAIPQENNPGNKDNRVTVRITSHNDFNANPNIVYLDWIGVDYTRDFSVHNGFLHFELDERNPRKITLTDLDTDPVFVFHPDQAELVEQIPNNGEIKFSTRVPEGDFWAVTSSSVRAPATITSHASTDWANTANEADYLIITTPFLRPSAEALASYRQTQNGYAVQIVEVQDIFDQFDYGRPTPLAVQRFIHATQKWNKAPRFLMLWGDTVYPKRDLPRSPWDVLSFGKSSSDGWFAMQSTDPDDWREVMAIGRIPIRDHESGMLFMQKLQTYEAAPLEDWQKRMLMLVGGATRTEQLILQSHMQSWGTQAVSAPTGMDTLNFFKNTSDVIDVSFQDSLRIAIKNGASWLGYFGHSAATTWEIVTDDPENYDNAQRLPIAISLGCQTGAFAGGVVVDDDVLVLAEKLVVGSHDGAIAHWGTSAQSSISASARLGNHLHQVVFSDSLRQIGTIFQEAKKRYLESGSFSLRELMQFGLIGDPATQLVIPTKPDLQLAQEHIRIAPVTPIPADSQLTVTAQLQNLGTVPSDSIAVQLAHVSANQSTRLYQKKVAPFGLRETINFVVSISDDDVGTNSFQVLIDPDNDYEEVSEFNNTAERTHVVFSTNLTLIAPLHLSAISTTRPSLRVTLVTQDKGNTPIFFELDTSPNFDSPELRTYQTVASNSFAAWNLETDLEADRPYYWRARIDVPNEPENWRESVFSVLSGQTSHSWFQAETLFDSTATDHRISQKDGSWTFTNYEVEVLAASGDGGGEFSGDIAIDGLSQVRNGRGFGVVILDRLSGAVRAASSLVTYENNLDEDPEEALVRLDSLVASAQEGDYVFVRTRHTGNKGGRDISDDVKDAFRTLGSSAIDTVHYDHLWLMMARIGFPSETWERVVPADASEIVLDTTLTFVHNEGIIQSPPIGPARTWSTLDWEAELPNAASQVVVDVLDAQSDDLLIGDLASAPFDLSSINAQQHPFLRLRATLSDSSRTATPQLHGWNVDYASTPEIILDASSFTVSADTLQEGAPLTVSGAAINLSDAIADSVSFSLYLTDAANRTSLIEVKTLTNVAPDSLATVSFEMNTDNLVGQNQLLLEAAQPGLTELITFNNTAITSFRVQGDSDPPVLQVIVEGLELPHDPNPIRDLQSPDIPLITVRPTIEVTFSDNNAFKPLSDTTLATVTLDGSIISFHDPELQFEPASETRNEARILYTPDFTGEDAVHTLRVSAFDVSGNEAEGSPYQVHFRVQSTFEVESLYPYPNPMSSFTRFAFLLKGTDPSVVEDFRIRVYTLTGRVVHEFDLVDDPSNLDGGQLRIGWNKLNWDGRDADGDLLANGVYLYKVYLKAEGQTYNVNNDTGIEKLVVLR